MPIMEKELVHGCPAHYAKHGLKCDGTKPATEGRIAAGQRESADRTPPAAKRPSVQREKKSAGRTRHRGGHTKLRNGGAGGSLVEKANKTRAHRARRTNGEPQRPAQERVAAVEIISPARMIAALEAEIAKLTKARDALRELA